MPEDHLHMVVNGSPWAKMTHLTNSDTVTRKREACLPFGQNGLFHRDAGTVSADDNPLVPMPRTRSKTEKEGQRHVNI
jgi:hypothetical protein